MKKTFFTSESVTEGHPDKVCDQISDAVLDEMLKGDPMARVACETCATTGLVLVMGEITADTYVDVPAVVRKTLSEIGYNNAKYGFDATNCAVINSIDEQSADIAMGVDKSYEAKAGESDSGFETGAGDQGMVFGYACNETPEFMPMPISFAHKLAKKLTKVRKNSVLDYLRPDGKTQVTVEYHDGVPARIDTIVVSTQHDPDIAIEKIREDVKREVILSTIPEDLIDEATKFYINPTGRFVIGGPQGDSGLTGRKIIVDTYGGYGRHGGGAFSGKDPTKVDRSAAYAARYVAKNIVASELAQKCEIQIAYAIGVAKPVSVFIDTFGTGIIDDEKISELVTANIDLRPAAIISKFNLRRPIYKAVAAYGHMGREDIDVPWEKLDLVEVFKNAVK